MSTGVDKVVQMTTALRKVKGNIERIFEKTPTDMIRGIRSSKGNEEKYISQCIEEIRMELKSEYVSVKVNAIAKLNYLQMLGHDISWAAFNVIEVFSTPKFSYKRVGYLVASQIFNENTEVLTLTTNQVRKDMHSASTYDAAVAMNGLACFVTTDLAHDLVNDVVILLNSSKPYIRKRAILLLYKLYVKYPDALSATFNRLAERLEDPDAGVQSAAVYVVCELGRRDPKSYLALAPVFFKLMIASSNNWMLIKIIKLFGCLTPLEPRLGKKLIEPLTNIINNTSAMSLLYECINTVLAGEHILKMAEFKMVPFTNLVLISISSEAPEEHMPSIQLCVQKLSVLIEDADQNLKYLGLLALGKILKTHPKAVQAMKDVILNCLDDRDESIRLRALDLIHGMVSKKNVMDIVKRLLYHVQSDSSATYRDNLVSKIIQICSYSNYKLIANFEWYISVLVELAKAEGTKNGSMIAQQMLDVAVRVVPVRHFAVSQMAHLVDNANVFLAGSWQYRSDISNVLYAAAWICGEYSEHLVSPLDTLEAMLRTKSSSMPGIIQAVYVQNIAKIYYRLTDALEKESDWDRLYSLDNLLLSKLPQFVNTDQIETQERTATLIEVVKEVDRAHKAGEFVGEDLKSLFVGDLNPVAPKAQRKLPIPDGLNLNENIYTPPSTDESDAEVAEVNLEVNLSHYAEPSKAAVDPQQLEKQKVKRLAEIQNNPHYLKSSKTVAKKNKAADELAVKCPTKPVEIQLESPLTILSWEEFEKRARQDTDGQKKRSKKSRRKEKGQSTSEPEDEELPIEIYQGDGEMPENAKSTDDECQQSYEAIRGSPKEAATQRKKKKKKSKHAGERDQFTAASSRLALPTDGAMNDFDLWLAGVDKKVTKKKKSKRKKSKKSDPADFMALICGIGDEQHAAAESCPTVSSCDFQPVVQDDHLSVSWQYRLNCREGEKGKLEVTVMMYNKTLTCLTGIELSVVDSVALKLTESLIVSTLEAHQTVTQKLSFVADNVVDAQRLRSMLTYIHEAIPEKLDFVMQLPFSAFMLRSSVSSLRFMELMEEGNLVEVCNTKSAETSASLNAVVEAICQATPLTLIEVMDDSCALLFARTLNDESICALLKKKKSRFGIELKSSNRSTVEAVATELKNIVDSLS